MNLETMKQYMDKELRPCIICNSKSFTVFAKKEYLTACKCDKCGMISVNPYYTEEGLKFLYTKYLSNRLSDKDLEEKRSKMYDIDRDWLLNYVNGGNLLDVGSSAGYFLSRFDPSKFVRHGVEFADECKDKARRMFDIPVRTGSFVEMEFDTQYDIVMMRGVIEHFVDPNSIINKISKIIKNGGYLFITATPNGKSFAFDVYRDKWSLFSIDHIHFFSIENLNIMMSKFGFNLVSYYYPYENTPYSNLEHDYRKIKEDIFLLKNKKEDLVDCSVPFVGSMITAIWRFEGSNT